ncbi:MAG: hypothetical protein V4602_08610 [Pseudomonadota bacterium]
MTNRTRRRDPDQDQDQKQDQDQDQKQANLQAQLQGQLQGQGQAQGQAQLAVQSLDSKSENDNENDNDNKNSNSNDNKIDNDLDNKVENSVDNKVDNDLDNSVENKIENTIDNKVNVEVDVKIDIDADSLSSPVIDLSCLSDVNGSVIMPDVVNQKLDGDGNIFNIDQVNNLVDKDEAYDNKVSYDGGDGDFKWDAKAEGGDSKMDSKIEDVIGANASGATSSADAALSQEAFNQTITQGANIQFNSITLNVAGSDFEDSHDLG